MPVSPFPDRQPSISDAIARDTATGAVAAAIGATNNGGFHLAAENLLNAANKLQGEVHSLQDALRQDGLKRIGICGPDPISGPAAAGFKAKIDPLVEHCNAYVNNLQIAVNTLKQQATAYGATDEQIAQSWQRFHQQSGRAPR